MIIVCRNEIDAGIRAETILRIKLIVKTATNTHQLNSISKERLSDNNCTCSVSPVVKIFVIQALPQSSIV